MALNYIWIGFFLISFCVGLVKLIFFQDYNVFQNMVNSTFDMAKTGFELSIYLTGIMALWLGLMNVGEKGGVIKLAAKLIGPFFSKIFPEIPKGHPAIGSILMNFSANFLGLDNAATPLGLKAMGEMQTLNPQKDTASNAQIMFLVLNTSGLSLIPLSIMADRSLQNAANPTDVFIPILIATFCSSLVGLVVTSIYQKINLLNGIVLSYILGFSIFIYFITKFFISLEPEQLKIVSSVSANLIIFSIMILFITMAVRAKVNVYETFIKGAKKGFKVAVKVIPYLVGILVAVGVFRSSGTLDWITSGFGYIFELVGINVQIADALPTALMKPLSGSASRGMMVETMRTFGADSFQGKMAGIYRGATETTFYVLAVYFGSVGIRKTRHALVCGLVADLAGIIAGTIVGYIFFFE